MSELQQAQRAARILLVEDNKGDIILTKRAFRESKISNELAVVTSGEDAVAYLKKEHPYADVVTPDLVLLDLNLPQMSGQDVLDFIKNDPRVNHIPIVVLSSSRAEQDVIRSYKLHANAYVVKPMNAEKFIEVVETLEKFWFSLVVLPHSLMTSPKS